MLGLLSTIIRGREQSCQAWWWCHHGKIAIASEHKYALIICLNFCSGNRPYQRRDVSFGPSGPGPWPVTETLSVFVKKRFVPDTSCRAYINLKYIKTGSRKQAIVREGRPGFETGVWPQAGLISMYTHIWTGSWQQAMGKGGNIWSWHIIVIFLGKKTQNVHRARWVQCCCGHIELPAKLLDYFLRSDTSKIHQYLRGAHRIRENPRTQTI